MTLDRLTAALADRYRLERELGQGGMATVYLADDLKHDRQVALKVLKPELAAVLGAERFVVEIKTTAALQHPHILPLFDSGSTGQGVSGSEFLYYVMPFIDGETLRGKLDRETQLDVTEAVRITTDIAEALHYAHQHGVIHRDIKPENILLANGRPMVADFGIALAVSAAAGGRMTETGLSLGTPHYMSPEQATAEKEISARSDVYSLASMLYEMLAGEPPHTGGSAQAIIMKIIAEPAQAVTKFRKSVPPNVAAALAKALEKVPADRFASAKAFAEALEDRHFTTASAAGAFGRSPVSLLEWWRSPFSWAAAALVAIGGGVAAVLAGRQTGPAIPAPVVAVSLIDSIATDLGNLSVAIADDGTILIARNGQILVRRPGEWTESLLSGADTVETFFAPVISPDGADVVYAAATGAGTALRYSLRRMPLSGGPASTLWTAPDGRTMARPLAWSEDGAIFVSLWRGSVSTSRLGRLSLAGGVIDSIAANLWQSAEVLPGGKSIVGCLVNAPADGGTVAVDLASGDTVRVLPNVCRARWSPTGHLLYVDLDGTMRAVPFDADRGAATGPAVPVRNGLEIRGSGGATFAVSRTGTLVYVAGPAVGGPGEIARPMALAGLDGSVSPIPLPPTDSHHGAFSPDGRQLAYVRNGQIWIYELGLGSHRQFTTVGSNHVAPVWAPDGTRLVYGARRAEGRGGDIYVQALTGDSVGVHIGGTAAFDTPEQWLADGTILTQSIKEGSTAYDIVAFHADQPGAGVPILHAPWDELGATVSPDGRWLAYYSDESGRRQIVVRAWPALDRKSVVADSVLNWPISWSPDSRTLYFALAQPWHLAAVSLVGTDSLRVASRRVAIAAPGGIPIAMHPDGRRFLVYQDVAPQSTTGPSARRSLIVVTNWFTALRQKLQAAGER